MTDFATHYVLGSPIASLVGKDKGDISNRGQCAGSQILNNVKTLAADTVVIGGAAATATAAKRSPKFMQKLANGFDKMVKALHPVKKRNVNLIGESGKVFKTFEVSRGQKAEKLLKMASKNKAIAMIALPATMLISYFTYKNIYKSGQIDQKYTDKAKIEKHQKNVLD